MESNEKPLTLNELAKYNQEVLFPFMKENFATKKDVENLIDIVATKEELRGLEERLVGKLDLIDKKLDKVDVIEKEVDYIKNSFNIPAIKNN